MRAEEWEGRSRERAASLHWGKRLDKNCRLDKNFLSSSHGVSSHKEGRRWWRARGVACQEQPSGHALEERERRRGTRARRGLQ